ncbi:MAG: PD40 domain-containing protein, partial [Bacteroidales bacterium]|nr:PD40 domain-containing protein [Bacteroidales bacterium]
MRKKLIYILIAFFLQFNDLIAQDHDNLDDYIKQADKLFENNDFVAAYPYYQTLRSNNSDNADYNFRLGVCMMFSESENKTRPIKYFVDAIDLEIEDNRVYYYLGRAYHNNYRFSDAQEAYTNYQKFANKRKVRSFDIEKRIVECKNGILLLSHVKLLYVVDKQLVRDETFYKSYNFKESFGRVISVPSVLKTKYDNKNNAPRFGVYLPEDNVIYFASYGKKGETGLDIYKSSLVDSREWSIPESLGDIINTPYDDAYPYITEDGMSLYFSSKGHNSMGGYDVFKTTFNNKKLNWDDCENLNFPTNTPFNDIFYVPDTSGALAYFSSNRQSLDGEIVVYHIGLDYKSKEQDLSMAFRDGSDATDLVRLLKDIAELKTNIDLASYRTSIDNIEDEEKPVEPKFNVNIDLSKINELNNAIASSYDSYKAINYKALKYQKKRYVYGKIIAEKTELVYKLIAKGDEQSLKEAEEQKKVIEISTAIVKKIDSHITELEKDAQDILEETENIYKYTNQQNYDSAVLAYTEINTLSEKNTIDDDFTLEVTDLLQANIVTKRNRSNDLRLKGKLLDIEVKDLREEMLLYKNEFDNIQDVEERQEYLELMALTKNEIAGKERKNKELIKEYEQLEQDANNDEKLIASAKETIKTYTESSSFIDETTLTEDELAIVDETIATEKQRLGKIYGFEAESSIANVDETISDTVNLVADTESSSIDSLENLQLSSIDKNDTEDIDTLYENDIANNDIGIDSTLLVSNADKGSDYDKNKALLIRRGEIAQNGDKSIVVSGNNANGDTEYKKVGIIPNDILLSDSILKLEGNEIIAKNNEFIEAEKKQVENAIIENEIKLNKLKAVAIENQHQSEIKVDEANSILTSISNSDVEPQEKLGQAKKLIDEAKQSSQETSIAMDMIAEGNEIQEKNNENIIAINEIKNENINYASNITKSNSDNSTSANNNTSGT